MAAKPASRKVKGKIKSCKPARPVGVRKLSKPNRGSQCPKRPSRPVRPVRPSRRPILGRAISIVPVPVEVARKIEEEVFRSLPLNDLGLPDDQDILVPPTAVPCDDHDVAEQDVAEQDVEAEVDPDEPAPLVDEDQEAEAVGHAAKVKKVVRKEEGPLQSLFDLNEVDSPLIGTPKEVQEELDGLALRMQKDPEDQEAFERILTYIHKYLLGLVFKKYNFVRGYEESDIYQEALIALFKKAVPKFDPNRGMSFLNFAKMCINRHLITILHASKHRRKDMPINTAISLDHNPNPSGDDDEGCALSNIIPDEKTSNAPYKNLARKESYARTLEVLKSKLSSFEVLILEEYLQEKSYEEAAKSVSKKTGVKYKAKSVDNSLLRIRSKSLKILRECVIDDAPIMF